MKIKEKIELLIERYDHIIEQQKIEMDDDGTYPQGTWAELEAELDCYILFRNALEELLKD